MCNSTLFQICPLNQKEIRSDRVRYSYDSLSKLDLMMMRSSTLSDLFIPPPVLVVVVL